jgi:peptidoglycan/xylan/chitin deacetylase (PgdA/CDA1 family)
MAEGIYYSGLLETLQRVSLRYELQFGRGNKWPRLRKVTTPKFLILCYHRVGVGGIPLYSELSPEIFEAQMRFLKRRYRVVSLEQVCQELQEPSTSEPGVAITFDDGYEDIYRYAFPVLRAYGLPATVFLIADCVDTGDVSWYDRVFLALQMMPAGRFEAKLDQMPCFQLDSRMSRIRAASEIISRLRKLPTEHRREYCAGLERGVNLPAEELKGRMLNWQQVRAMQHAGITFGSHTVTHPVVSRLTAAELEYELLESKKRLESGLNKLVGDFAFPFGHLEDCGAEAAALLRRCGYRSGFTTIPGVNTRGADPFALRRIQIGEEHTSLPMFAFRLAKHFLLANPAQSGFSMELAPNRFSADRSQSGLREGPRHA